MKTIRSLPFASMLLLATPSAYCAQLLNSSYDVSRELFAALNPVFIQQWQSKHPNEKLVIKQSHGGSSKQALAILSGLPADVVTFNQVPDVQLLHDRGNLLPADWESRLPNHSSPYYSTMAFVVRQGNPQGIHDWRDLIKPGIKLIYPNPQTSGNGRYTWLAAWGAFTLRHPNDVAATRHFMQQLINHTIVSDVGGRGATTSFLDRQLGDVLITFESEARELQQRYPEQHFDVVVPQENIRAEFPVTWIEKNTEKAGNTELAKSYLNFLYQPAAQNILTRFYYRTYHADQSLVARQQFPQVKLFTVEQQFGSWSQAMTSQFSATGEYQQLQALGKPL